MVGLGISEASTATDDQKSSKVIVKVEDRIITASSTVTNMELLCLYPIENVVFLPRNALQTNVPIKTWMVQQQNTAPVYFQDARPSFCWSTKTCQLPNSYDQPTNKKQIFHHFYLWDEKKPPKQIQTTKSFQWNFSHLKSQLKDSRRFSNSSESKAPKLPKKVSGTFVPLEL